MHRHNQLSKIGAMARIPDRTNASQPLPATNGRGSLVPAGVSLVVQDIGRAPALLVPTAAGAVALEAARGYAGQALSPSTRRAYEADWEHYQGWCRDAGWEALPAAPAGVAAYLASMAHTHARATIERRLVSIGQRHKLAGEAWIPSHPLIRATLRGMWRTHGQPARQAAALASPEVKQLVATCGTDLTGLRDRALLLLGLAAALRRAELAAVEREHLDFRSDGSLRLLLPRAKGDQEGEGEWIGLPRGKHGETCPVRALEAWLRAVDCHYGPVFRKVDQWRNVSERALHPDAVRQILLRRAAEAGLRVSSLERLSPHGLRAGFVTEAYQAGARDEHIMAHTRHRDLKTMRGYVRRARLVQDSPAKLLGL